MADERREADDTRKLLRAFGVTVTEYEERTRTLLERAAAAGADDLVDLSREALRLSANLNERLREVTDHVLATQSRVLHELREAIARARQGEQPD